MVRTQRIFELHVLLDVSARDKRGHSITYFCHLLTIYPDYDRLASRLAVVLDPQA